MILRLTIVGQIAVLFAASAWPLEAQTSQTGVGQETAAPMRQELRLSAEATQVGDQTNITSLVEKLRTGPAAGSPMTVEALALRQQITEKVLAASLDIDSVNAVIDLEIEKVRAIRSDLQSRRDKAQNIINVASLATGGALGVVNTALQFNSNTVNLGNGIGVGGGVTAFVLSVIGIHKRGGRRALGDSPRMLARLFGRQPNATEAIPSTYPEAVWSYLNSAAPSEPAKGTRREKLIAKWRDEGRVKQDGSSKSEWKIDALSGNIPQSHKLSISELDDRVAMLLDLRTQVSLMKRDLSEILRSLGARQQ